jgi:hypothetical protein
LSGESFFLGSGSKFIVGNPSGVGFTGAAFAA